MRSSVELLERRVFLDGTLVEGQVVTSVLTPDAPTQNYDFEATEGTVVPLYIADFSQSPYTGSIVRSNYYAAYKLYAPDGTSRGLKAGSLNEVAIAQSGMYRLEATNYAAGGLYGQVISGTRDIAIQFSWGRKLDLVIQETTTGNTGSTFTVASGQLRRDEHPAFGFPAPGIEYGPNDLEIIASLTINYGPDNDVLTLESGGIPVTVRMGDGNDTATVNSPNVTLYGGHGNDRLTGQFGSETVFRGGVGDDVITAGSTRDLILGGVGANVLTGASRMADVDGNGTDDVISTDPATNNVTVTFDNNTSRVLGTRDLKQWALWDVADITGDGRPDLLWVNRQAKDVDAWDVSDNFNPLVVPIGQADLNVWRIAGVGDLTGDGRNEILWVNRDQNYIGAWDLAAERPAFFPIASADLAHWDVAGAGDVTGDGTADVVFQASPPVRNDVYSQAFGAWVMDAGQPVEWTTIGFQTTSTWQLTRLEDRNGDGTTDLIFDRTYLPAREQVWYVRDGVRYSTEEFDLA